MSLEIIIRYINLLLSAGTIPAMFLLIKHFIEDKTQDTTIRAILLILFAGLLITMLLAMIINIMLLFLGYSVSGAYFLANARNLILNVSLFGISWGLLYIRRVK